MGGPAASLPDASAPSAPGLDGKALRLIACCSLAYFLDGLIPVLMGPLAAPIGAALQLDRTEMGAVFSANLLGQCLGLFAVPLLARGKHHRAVILWMTLGFGLSQLLSTFAQDRETLLLSRFITGIFLGGALPSGLAAVTQGSPPARRGLATMLLFTAYGLGSAVAGFLGGLFVAGDGWRSAFIVTGGACLLAAAVIWRWLEEPPVDEDAAVPVGAAPLASSNTAILRPPLLAGTLLLWLLFFCALTIYYCLSSWLPTLLVDTGRSPQLAANALGSYASGGVISGLLIGPLIDRYGARRVLGLFIGLSALLLPAIGLSIHRVPDALLLAMLASCGFFMLGAYGGSNVLLAGFYPAALRAVGVGWTKSVSRLGTVLPPFAIGYGLSHGIDAGTVVTLFAVPALLMLAAVLLVRMRGDQPEAS